MSSAAAATVVQSRDVRVSWASLLDPAPGREDVTAEDVRRRIGYLTLPAALLGWAGVRAADAGSGWRTVAVTGELAAPVLGLVAGMLVLRRSFPPGRTAPLTAVAAGAPVAALGVLAAAASTQQRSVAGGAAFLSPVVSTALVLAGLGAYRLRGRVLAAATVLLTTAVVGPMVAVGAALAAYVTDLALPLALVPLHFLLVRAALAPVADEL